VQSIDVISIKLETSSEFDSHLPYVRVYLATVAFLYFSAVVKKKYSSFQTVLRAFHC